MSTSNDLTVLPMTEEDMAPMTQLLHKAYYSPDGVSGLLYHTPPSQASLDRTTAQRVRDFRDEGGAARFVKAVDAATGALVACARWDFYRHARSDAAVAAATAISDDELIPEFNVDVYSALFGPLRAAHRDIMGTRPHAYLVTLVTDPDEGRRGAGGLLVRWGLDRADELGLDAYLGASPMGKGLYEKNGFETVRTVPFDMKEWGGEGVVSHVVSALYSKRLCVNVPFLSSSVSC